MDLSSEQVLLHTHISPPYEKNKEQNCSLWWEGEGVRIDARQMISALISFD